MRAWLRKLWPVFKWLFTLAIVFAIGRSFARDLRVPELGVQGALTELWGHLVNPGWLIVSGVLYILGLGFSAFYWYRLLRELDQRPGRLEAVRAYYVGHAGKYLPGKAWAVFLRAGLVRGPSVSFARAVLTTFYEVLVTMAGGTVLAIALVALLAPDTSAGMDWDTLWKLLTGHKLAGVIDRKVLVLLGVVLLLPIGIPILPPVYNWIIARMATRIRKRYGITGPMARVTMRSMVEGLLLTACGWMCMGASLWSVLRAFMPDPPALTLSVLGRYSAYLALAYVAGFLIFLVPSGLAIREHFLKIFLITELTFAAGADEAAVATAAAAALFLRLVWTAAEIIVLPALYLLPAWVVKGAAKRPEHDPVLATASVGASNVQKSDAGQGSAT
jgi:glycosyltransferase 2 family protein